MGRFASADTIVSNPANPQSFNRYSYVNNNPLGYIDPSGNFGVCFEGGQADTVDGDGFASQICEDLANDGAFGPSKEYKVFANNNEGIDQAHMYMIYMMMMFPNDPIVILGYSWGGGAALEFVTYLSNYKPWIEIDALILVDPVLKWRENIGDVPLLGIQQRGYYPIEYDKNGNPIVPPNVKATLNLSAQNAIISEDGLPHDSGIRNVTGNRDSKEEMENILNVTVSSTNHCTIGYATCYFDFKPKYGAGYNPNTYNMIFKWLTRVLKD